MLVSAFARLTLGRRAYSSFFSSKSGGGGGRYLNSAKPSKVIVPSNKVDSPVAEVSTSDSSQTPIKPGTSCKAIVSVSGENPPSSPSSSPPPLHSTNAVEGADASADKTPSLDTDFSIPHQPQYHHPVVSTKDFKLHQFFSLHRPLLLLANPSAVLEPSPTPTFDLAQLRENTSDADACNKTRWLLDELSGAPFDADADAATARQLAYALTMSHAGAAVSWEETLRRLGLDLSKEPERVQLREQMDMEWEVVMDSTKRKRRKKMKKHKLKKRRKATRAQRLKIGR